VIDAALGACIASGWVGRAVMPAQGEPRAHAARRTQQPQLAQSAVIRKRILDIAESLAQIQETYVRSNLIRCRFLADTVAKVENRTTPKIPQKQIFSRLPHCNTPQRPYEAPWSFLCETMWSLISLRAKRISGPEKFWSPQKDFFNTIGTKLTCHPVQRMSACGSKTDSARTPSLVG